MSTHTRALGLILATFACSGCREPHTKPWSIAAPDQATLRTTTLGPVIGGEGRYGNHAWLGIPFAAPPVGDLRWRAPHPATPWTGTREALTPASGCTQFASGIGGMHGAEHAVVGSEDCLYVNIAAPRFAPDQVPTGKDRLPVMFWIHGGGNSIGTSAFYDGGHLAANEHVIVVTTQYRLGPFGWFRDAALRDETKDPAEQSGNFGTLDLIQSLRWVHDNIAAFGGDPDNVTIFGESAGGGNVYTLLLSPLAKGLFQRAIVESGGLSETTTAEAETGHRNSSSEVVSRLMQRASVTPNPPKRPALGESKIGGVLPSRMRAFLREQSAADILQSYAGDLRLGMIDMPLVFHDGVVLPVGDWLAQFADPAGWNRVPVIVGSNHDEFKLFLAFDPEQVWRLFGVFPRVRNVDDYEATAEYMSRSWKANGVDRPVEAMLRSGAKDVYAYRFDWHGEPTVGGTNLGKLLGAAHAMEIPFVFGHFNFGRLGERLFDARGAPDRQQLSDSMMSYWGEFARSGSPGSGRAGDQIPWPAWDESKATAPKFIVLDTPSEGGVRMSSDVQNRERIYQDIDGDQRLPTQRDKCRIFRMLTGFTHGLEKADYPHVGRTGCADYPLEKYPWR